MVRENSTSEDERSERLPGTIVRAIILSDGNASDSVDFKAITEFLLARRWKFIAFMLAGGILMFGASYAISPKYRAEVLMAPVASESSGGLSSLLSQYGALASTMGVDLGNDDQTTTNALATLKSRQFIERFIVDNNILELFRSKWFKPTDPTETDRVRIMQAAYERFSKRVLSVRQDRSTKLVTVRVEWKDRELAAKWANDLVARINATTREVAIREADDSLKYLQTEFLTTQIVQLKDSISSLIEAQINKRMMANTRPDYAFKIIDPAQPSAVDKYVSPNRALFFLLGAFLGFLIALWSAVRGVSTR